MAPLQGSRTDAEAEALAEEDAADIAATTAAGKSP
jgi:hypothetical protein